ncbi:protein N-lysine methyltransferase family protein [Stieleria sp. TO1_6]|uniref:class I SAM-dependent methyltransferase n=1 Tax=Stieleria tagensis TaxID=2956795 RepID=UPI00209AF5A8|nr:protein N-lysine methyltransferase family protein [Stieleria tagensis]MCO8121733.1 protein N-lysine methyltransferase family protein [Stieleria tagensis]
MSTTEHGAAPQELLKIANELLDWRWDDTPIAGQTWPLAVAADPDAMLIEACERQDAGESGVIDPFWAATWRAAAGLDQYLDRIEVSGKKVLELGCGTGHAGISAALRGGQVTLTDGVEDPLHLVRLSSHGIADRCDIRRLRFGIDRLEQRYPIILGSDVTYLRQLWPELEQCLNDHLEPGGVALLSDPYRIIANEFRQWIGKRPWQYVEHKIEMKDDPQHPIRVMELRASPATVS